MYLLTPSSLGGLPTLSLTTNSSWLPWGMVVMPLVSPLMRVPQVNYPVSKKNRTLYSCPSGGSTGGGDRPLDWGQTNFIARPKNTHLQTPLCMLECAKTRLQQSRISKYSGGRPRTPLFKGREGEGRGGEGGEREGKEGGEG